MAVAAGQVPPYASSHDLRLSHEYQVVVVLIEL